MRITDGNGTDWYIIQTPQHTKNNSINATVTCPHISTLLKTKNIYLEFDDENGIGKLPYLAAQILAGTGWSVGKCDKFLERDGQTEKVRSLKSNSNEGSYALITKMCKLFNAYPLYHGDTKKVDFFSLNNQTVEWEMVVGKNLDGLSVKYDSDCIVTRLYVEGEYSDFGYVGIDDVNPTGLSYLMNFDYYKEIGLFTDAHQAALDQYLADAALYKGRISAAQSNVNTYTNQVVNLAGSIPFTVWRAVKNSSTGVVTITKYQVNGATVTPGVGKEIVLVKSSSNCVIKNNTYSDPTRNLTDGTTPYMIYFETKPLGQIGVNEAAIEAKQLTIDSLNKKKKNTSDADKIAEYNRQIDALSNEIETIKSGSGTNSLYNQLYRLAIAGINLVNAQNTVKTNQDALDMVEATFLAAVSDMLRDGRWTDENYTVGQEEALYADALDMSERLGKPEVTYTINWKNVESFLGYSTNDIDINVVGHIWDESLNVNDYGYIKSITTVYDKPESGRVEVTTDDGYSNQVSLESVLTRIGQLAEIIKAKNALFERAGALGSNGQLAADRLEGVINVMKNKLSSTISNWYTDDNGNIIFESVNGTGAMMLCGEGFMIASGKDGNGNWDWRTKTCHWFSV